MTRILESKLHVKPTGRGTFHVTLLAVLDARLILAGREVARYYARKLTFELWLDDGAWTLAPRCCVSLSTVREPRVFDTKACAIAFVRELNDVHDGCVEQAAS